MLKSLLLISCCCLGFVSLKAQTYVPEKNEASIKVKPAVPVRAYSFDLSDVRLLNSPFRKAMDADSAYLLELDPDRFLAQFRIHSGLQPKGKVYGGWESEGLAGHSLGHYLSACSLEYAATGDTSFRNRVNYIVDQLAICQTVRGTGYIGAIPNEDSIFGEVAKGHISSHGFDLNGGWSPWYTVHKIMAGLLDAYLNCHNQKALSVEKGMADWAAGIVKNLDEQEMQKMLVCEYGGMNEVLANTYAITGDKKYLQLAYRFYDHRILDSLAREEDILPGNHANTQVPKIIGCARLYELTGDPKMDSIASYFWQVVVNHHIYATGGTSNYEYFGPEDQLPLSDNNTETCVTYNMLKLTRHLFALQPSAHLMDYYERGLYNHILASQDHQTGMMVYFTPLRMGGRKEYSTPFNTFTCCVGTGMENHTKYAQTIYFQGSDGSLYLNLFIPSVLRWKAKHVVIRQENNFPEDDTIRLSIQTQGKVNFPLRIRKPYWAYHGVMIMVNGKKQSAVLDKDGYLSFDRQWKNNDQVRLIIPVSIHQQSMAEDSNRIAIFYGPELLSGVFGDDDPSTHKGVPVFVNTDPKAADWINKNKSSLVFHSDDVGHPQDVKLIPFNQTENQYYSVYWDEFSPAGWKQQQKIYEEEKQRKEDIEKRTVDEIRLGEMQPERDHHFAGDHLYVGEAQGKKFRVAGHGGLFSFDMKVSQQAGDSLICTYWGMDNRNRKFDIMVNDTKVATVDLNDYRQSHFYQEAYPVPQAAENGHSTVKITFKALDEHNSAGPVYDVRLIRASEK